MRALTLVLLAAIALPGVAPARAQGPSFDCAKAGTDTERAICADPALSALERKMSEAYAAASRRLAGDPRALRALREEQG